MTLKAQRNFFLAKTLTFFNRFVPVIVNPSTGQIRYGLDDLLPNNNLRLINDCGVAKRCARKKARYIQGDGFANKDLSKMKVNPKQTADKLLQQISSYAAYNEGFALEIRRNASGEIAEVKSIPFECVRKMQDGSLSYNPKKGQKDFNDSDTTYHPAFFGLKPTSEQLQLITKTEVNDERGKNVKNKFFNHPEILYVYEETADNPFYPVPDYNAGIEDIQTCIEISKMDLELSENGFMPSAVLTTGEIDSVNKDDKQKTPYDYFSNEIESFTGRKKDENGKSGRFKLLHIMSNTANLIDLKSFDVKSILESSNAKRDIIAREVCRLFGVHPILVGFSDAAVLGNQQALNNAIVDFNNYINPIQRMISDAFSMLYPDNDWMIKEFNPIGYIPAEVWAVLTTEEKREIGGFEAVAKITETQTQPDGANTKE